MRHAAEQTVEDVRNVEGGEAVGLGTSLNMPAQVGC
jgi:hypothetical protein